VIDQLAVLGLFGGDDAVIDDLLDGGFADVAIAGDGVDDDAVERFDDLIELAARFGAGFGTRVLFVRPCPSGPW
jgi:hypothetical protein